MIYSFRGMVPVVHPSAFVHPQATLIGHVTVGEDCYVGPHAVLRGDWGKIVLKRGVNVQEGCVLHMFPGTTVLLEESAHIGHGAMIHGAHIGKNCLVGMNAVVMDDVVLGEGCVVGALGHGQSLHVMAGQVVDCGQSRHPERRRQRPNVAAQVGRHSLVPSPCPRMPTRT